MAIKEVFKDIPDYEGLYKVSNLGNIKSFNRVSTGIILKDRITKSGYNRCVLYKNKIPKHILVHRIVAKVFIQNTYNKPHINHKDSNKLNNNSSNLEWVTPYENLIHSISNNRNTRGRKIIGIHKITNKKVKYDKIVLASKDLGIHKASISSNLRGYRKSAGNFNWKYKK